MECVITLNSTGFGRVKNFELYCGKKRVSSALVKKYDIVVEKNFVMVFTYEHDSSTMHSHAFSVDRVVDDFCVYVPKAITEREERKKRREAKKAEIERKDKEAKIALFEIFYTRKWIYVESTNLYGVYYAPNCKDLKIIFKSNKNKVYVYHGVEIEVFAGLLGASSKGKYFNEVIKGNYMWEVE